MCYLIPPKGVEFCEGVRERSWPPRTPPKALRQVDDIMVLTARMLRPKFEPLDPVTAPRQPFQGARPPLFPDFAADLSVEGNVATTPRIVEINLNPPR